MSVREINFNNFMFNRLSNAEADSTSFFESFMAEREKYSNQVSLFAQNPVNYGNYFNIFANMPSLNLTPMPNLGNFQNYSQNFYPNLSLNNNSPVRSNNNAVEKPVDGQGAAPLSKNKRIELVKEYLKYVEGGYANVKGDKGGATKHGVTHFTYDGYRKRKHLPLRSVKEMTDKEFEEIIEYFWTKSGADKISNPILAFYVFSTDWGSGIGKSKKFLQQCGGDPQKFEQIRRDFYNRIAVGTNAQFKRGWQNRVTKDHNFAYSKFANNQNNSVA